MIVGAKVHTCDAMESTLPADKIEKLIRPLATWLTPLHTKVRKTIGTGRVQKNMDLYCRRKK